MQIKFSIIGTGNIAWFLVDKLCKVGFHFEGIYGRNIEAANKIATQYSGRAFNHLAEIPDAENHFCFTAVKDSAISLVIDQLKFHQTTLIHTAGASSINILQANARNFGAFWPIYSIVRTNDTLPNDIPIAIEGNNEKTEQAILHLGTKISERAFIANADQRLKLHLAAVFANNFTNHLITIAEDICAANHTSFDFLKPILSQTFKKLENHSAKEIQTGPARRNDMDTMDIHLKLLHGNKELIQLYQTISMSIRKMYEIDTK